MMTLVNLTILLIIASCSAAFAKFLDFCFEEGNVLRFYYKWILKVGQVEIDDLGRVTSSNRWWKPLGGCLVCFNFWISVPGFVWFASMVENQYNPAVLIMLFFFYQGVSGSMVQIIAKSYE